MAKRDASKKLGGMAGKAASALRGRQAQLDAAESSAGSSPAKKKPAKKTTKKK